MPDDIKEIPSDSICFCCKHSMVMVVAQRRAVPGKNTLSQQPEMKVVFQELHQTVCHRFGAPMVIGSESRVQACTEWEAGAGKTLQVPGHMEAPKSIVN